MKSVNMSLYRAQKTWQMELRLRTLNRGDHFGLSCGSNLTTRALQSGKGRQRAGQRCSARGRRVRSGSSTSHWMPQSLRGPGAGALGASGRESGPLTLAVVPGRFCRTLQVNSAASVPDAPAAATPARDMFRCACTGLTRALVCSDFPSLPPFPSAHIRLDPGGPVPNPFGCHPEQSDCSRILLLLRIPCHFF